MADVLFQHQLARHRFLLRHPMEALEPRVLLSSVPIDAASLVCVPVANTTSAVAPANCGAVSSAGDAGAPGGGASDAAPIDAQVPAATPLDASGTASGNISDAANQIDTYSFQATAGQNYSVQINTTTLADGSVSIVDQDGVSQLDGAEAIGTGTSGSVVWQAPADGTYYLQVSSGDGQSTGTYSVSVSVAPAPVATPLDPSGTASGNISDAVNQTDTYS
ncbi:MAG: pre-peptidase C-terminal domain-containing protein, partial [Tepidisphaerales bacterium]